MQQQKKKTIILDVNVTLEHSANERCRLTFEANAAAARKASPATYASSSSKHYI
jgi:hypothetical protein